MLVQSLAAPPPWRMRPAHAAQNRPRRVTDPSESDAELMATIARGDRQAFQRLFLKFAPRVKAYLIRLGAPAAGAEEMTQDAMLSVWRRASSFDPRRAGVSTWIFVIARNCWIDRLRRERVELAYRNASDETEETAPEADAAVLRSEMETRVEAAMQTLSEEQRQVVRLSFFEEKSHSEIAEALAQPLGTVKSRLRLAMAKLRTQLQALA